ncbi:MAG: UTP--glucose-1-phosphate uridylyltransferase GalU [Alphaproteobacteria bacterium]
MFKPVKKAVFPVAGLGTRFLPATKAMPKEMLTLVDKPLIQYAVEEAKAAGIEEFIFVTSRGKDVLEDHFDINPELNITLEQRGKAAELATVKACEIPSGHLYFTRQHQPLGLGHAIWCARHIIGNEPFAILLPDDVVLGEQPCLVQMVEAYNRLGGNLVGVTEVPRAHTNRYGILDIGQDDGKIAEVKGLVEKPKPEDAPSTLSIIGRYILQPQVFSWLEKGNKGAGGEIQITDAMARLIGKQAFHGLRFSGVRYDCGDKLGFLQANIAFALKRPDLGQQLAEWLQTYAQDLAA